METIINQIKLLLKDISAVTDNTVRTENEETEIDYFNNPLEPNLLSYCFDNILGFDVKYRISEKVNYIIEFDYKGTYAVARHYKMSYRVTINDLYKEELIKIFDDVKPLIEKLFELIGENALLKNEFSMKNKTDSYLSKLMFYECKIEALEKKKNIIQDKTDGQYDIEFVSQTAKIMKPKCSDYLLSLEKEMVYDIETYIDTFFSALEHILTLLYPFTEQFSILDSYYKKYIRSPKWSWDKKYKAVLGTLYNENMYNDLKRIKEIFRNHNAHGGFSREMMAYVYVPNFGRYPLYIGQEYLKGFINGEDEISYELYLETKCVFNQFFSELDLAFKIPMLFVKSGLPIPVDTSVYTKDIDSAEDAQKRIEKIYFEIDNQLNMDW